MHLRKTLITTCLLLASTAAMANEAELTVTGKIMASGCHPTFNRPDMNWGTEHHTKRLKHDREVRIEQYMTISVICAAPTKFAMKWTDNRDPSHLHPGTGGYYGFGKDADGKAFGSAFLAYQGATANGVAVQNIMSEDGLTDWRVNSGSKGAHQIYTHALAATGVPEPLAITNANINMRVVGIFRPTREVNTTESLVVDGNVSMEMIYL